MAVLRQGSVISATVEQSLGNCLLVHFKHRSRTFRGVLFDEKNSVVARTTISKQSDDQKLMSNKSSLPLGMAVVSPSKQPYSSLRNRIYFNTTSKRPGGSNSRGNVSKPSETRGNFQAYSGLTGKDTVNCREGSLQSHTKTGQDGLSELDTRHSSRLLRQRCKISSNDGNGLKRKAESELAGTKPPKSRSNVNKSETTSVIDWDSSKIDSKTHRKTMTSKSSRGKVIAVSSNSNDKTDSTENVDRLLSCGDEQSGTPGSNENNTESTITVRQNLFPPDHDLKTSNVFSNDQSESQGISNEGSINSSGSYEVAAFFGSLGLGSACNDRDDSSIFTDSGTSCSSTEQLGQRPEFAEENKDNLNNESELHVMDFHGVDECEAKNDDSSNRHFSLTPTKKSARISAKRAILEQNMASYNHDDNTIWSIWGGVPSQKQKDRQYSSSDAHVQVDSPESLPEIVNVSPADSSTSTDSTVENKPLCSTTVRVKGARMKQTPVSKAKKTSNNVTCIPEKQVSVGNIVWGKVHGHPWWPGRVLAVSGNFGEGSETTNHAHVTWFGSNTSSIMPVNELQHFVANFSRRHKKAKRGGYRKAVKQAQDMLQIMGEEI